MDDLSLVLLWRTSLAMAAMSILVLTALILARFANAAGAARRRRSRQGLTRLLIEISTGQPPDDPGLMKLTRNAKVTAQALVEFSTLVRGDDLANALRQLQAAGLGRRLRPLLKNRNREVRLVAIEALGLVMDARSEAALKRIVRRGRSLSESVAAARALQASGRGLEPELFLKSLKFNHSEAPMELEAVLRAFALQDADTLVAALSDPEIDRSAKVQIITALGASGRFELLETLAALARGASLLERAAAVGALGALGHPGARDALAAALHDEEPEVRSEAAEAVGAVRLDDLIPELAGLLGDRSWPVRFEAARAMLKLGDKGRQALMEAATSPGDPRAGRTASLVLAEGALR